MAETDPAPLSAEELAEHALDVAEGVKPEPVLVTPTPATPATPPEVEPAGFVPAIQLAEQAAAAAHPTPKESK